MACRENESQEVVTNVVLDCSVEIGHAQFLDLELTSQLVLLPLEVLISTKHVDRSVLGGSHQPRPRSFRDASLGPLLKSCDERILGELLRQSDVIHNSRDARYDLRRFDSPDSLDRFIDVVHGRGVDDR
jgi:hypothetical protein